METFGSSVFGFTHFIGIFYRGHKIRARVEPFLKLLQKRNNANHG